MNKYTKGTGPVDIGSWVAPMKSRPTKKGYAMGGTIWPDATSPWEEGLPISGGSANLPGGTVQTGGVGVYDPKNPQAGAQGWSTFYQPSRGASEDYEPATGTMGGKTGRTSFFIDPTHPRSSRPK